MHQFDVFFLIKPPNFDTADIIKLWVIVKVNKNISFIYLQV